MTSIEIAEARRYLDSRAQISAQCRAEYFLKLALDEIAALQKALPAIRIPEFVCYSDFDCPRCGARHGRVPSYALRNVSPGGRWDHFAYCPQATDAQPVFLKSPDVALMLAT